MRSPVQSRFVVTRAASRGVQNAGATWEHATKTNQLTIAPSNTYTHIIWVWDAV